MKRNFSIILIVGIVVSAFCGYTVTNFVVSNQINELEKKNSDIMNDIEELQNIISNKNEEIRNITEKYELLEVAAELLIGEKIIDIEKAQIELQDKVNYINDLLDQISFLEYKNYELQNETNDAYKIIVSLEEQNRILQNELDILNEEKLVQLGVISSSKYDINGLIEFFSYIEDEVNNYCNKIGSNFRFQFLIDNALDSPPIHLEKIQGLKYYGVDFVIGAGQDDLAEYSLPYANENHVLLFSPSSMSSTLAIPNDNLFRLIPSVEYVNDAIVEMISSWGIKAIFTLHYPHSHFENIYSEFKQKLFSEGIIIIDPPSWVCEGTSCYLEWANEKVDEVTDIWGKNNTGFMLYGYPFTNALAIIEESTTFSNLKSICWFGSYTPITFSKIENDNLEILDQIKFFNVHFTNMESPIYQKVMEEYTGGVLPSYFEHWYDIAWIYVKAILETGSVDPIKIKNTIPVLAESFYGASGWCKLNENGDKETENLVVWGFDLSGNMVIPKQYGIYDSSDKKIIWDVEELGFNLPG